MAGEVSHRDAKTDPWDRLMLEETMMSAREIGVFSFNLKVQINLLALVAGITLYLL